MEIKRTIDELNNGYLSFGISKKDKNNKIEENKYISIKNGILEITENDNLYSKKLKQK